jgi:hypothetical protein
MSSSDTDADSRHAAITKKKLADTERFVVRFIEDDTYMIGDRSHILEPESIEIVRGSVAKVLYDKVKNKSGDAAVVYAGDPERVTFLESKLSLLGYSKESEVLETFEADFANRNSAIQQQRSGNCALTG